MFGKSTQAGLVSLVVVLAAALGGCAESVRGEPTNVPVATHTQVAFSPRYTPHLSDADNGQVVRVDALVSSKGEPKRTFRGAADVR